MKIKYFLLSSVFLLKTVIQGAALSYDEKQIADKFKLTFQCADKGSQSICNNVEDVTKKIAYDLTNILEISNAISFNVYVDKLSKFEKEDNIICQCVDTNMVALKFSSSDDKAYTFPQALAKQLTLDKNITYRENDFTLLVNVDGLKKMGAESDTNVLYIAMFHEILHGLGVLQTLSLRKLGKDDVNYVLLPKRISATTREEVDKIKNISDFDVFDEKFGGFYPLSIYEKNIVDINSKNYLFSDLTLLFDQVNCFDKDITLNAMTNENYKQCIGKLPNQTQQLISTLPGSHFLKYHSMGFLNSQGKVIPLQTFDNEYHSGSSVVHIEFPTTRALNSVEILEEVPENEVTQHFNENLLMCSYPAYPSESLFLQNFGQNNKYGWISSDILSILTTMGWTEKGMPKSTQKYYVHAELPESLTFPLTIKEFYPKQSIDNGSSSSSRMRATSSTILIITMVYFMIHVLL